LDGCTVIPSLFSSLVRSLFFCFRFFFSFLRFSVRAAIMIASYHRLNAQSNIVALTGLSSLAAPYRACGVRRPEQPEHVVTGITFAPSFATAASSYSHPNSWTFLSDLITVYVRRTAYVTGAVYPRADCTNCVPHPHPTHMLSPPCFRCTRTSLELERGKINNQDSSPRSRRPVLRRSSAACCFMQALLIGKTCATVLVSTFRATSYHTRVEARVGN
jgi:hypothetical protein